MAQSRSFSIFLLKEGYDQSSAVRNDSKLIESVPATNLPHGATLMVLDGADRPPWWKSYFGVDRKLLQSTKGALVFLPVQGKVFALAFGHVGHNLMDDSYEYDFGIKVTLNCVDPGKLKNTDTLEPGSARRQRTQHAIETDLTYFDFDRDSAILKSITGKVKDEHRELLRHATGASSLRVSTPVTSAGLIELCKKLIDLYEDDSYKTSFPDIQKIAPVRDPSQVEALNSELETQIRTQADSITMAVPEMLDYTRNSDSVYAMFTGTGASLLYSDVSIENYYSYLDDNDFPVSSLTIEQLKRHRLQLVNEYGDLRDSFNVFRSILFDATFPGTGAAFYLNEGNWYEVELDYVKSLQDRLDPYWSELSFLTGCNEALEAGYNQAIAGNRGFVCLDKTNFTPEGQTQIEPCDVYSVIDGHATLIHVKISTASSTLSHLFNQGANSIELLKTDDAAPGRLIERLKVKAKKSDSIEELRAPIDLGDYLVVFAIITRKDSSRKSLNLPLFSRISLARNIRYIHRAMGVPVQFGFVKDLVARSSAKKKKKPKASSEPS